jgi:arabinofuranosyltransferase
MASRQPGLAPGLAPPWALRLTGLRDLRWLPALAAFAVFLFQVRKFCQSALSFVDDPFISMRYAANLVLHGELSFNPGDRVEGYSNFLHVLLLALEYKLRGVPAAAAGMDGAARGVFAATLIEVALLGLLARPRPGGKDDERDGIAWYYAWIFTTASWPFAFWACAGLEAPLEGLAYVAILFVCSKRAFAEGRAWAVGLAAALLIAVVLLRFEGAVPALAVVVALGASFVRAGRTRAAFTLGAPVVAATGLYHVWRLVYFGQLMPNTFIAKATGGTLQGRLAAGVSYCSGWFGLVGGAVALAVVAFALLRAPRIGRRHLEWVLDRPLVTAACVLVAVKLALVTWGGGDWMPGWRMLLPITPIVLFLVARLLVQLVDRGIPWRPTGLAAVALALGLVMEGRGALLGLVDRDGIPNDAGGFKKVPRANLVVADLLERGFAGNPDEVALGEVGIIPFEAMQVRFLDMFGLVDRDMARQPGHMHARVHAAHLVERAPVAVVFAHLHEQPPFGPYQYGAELLPSPAFHAAYRRVDLDADLTTLGWAIYLRRDVDAAAHGLAWSTQDP